MLNLNPFVLQHRANILSNSLVLYQGLTAKSLHNFSDISHV